MRIGAMDGCPCGTGEKYGRCCGPLHAGAGHANTAEELMRSRYSAFVTADSGYLLRTWHPRTRPDRADLGDDISWTGLTVADVVDGGPAHEEGLVGFQAAYVDGQGPGVQSERSRFTRRGGRWVYVGPAD